MKHSNKEASPEKVFTSQTVWGNDELVEQLDETARAHRLLRKPGFRGAQKPSPRQSPSSPEVQKKNHHGRA